MSALSTGSKKRKSAANATTTTASTTNNATHLFSCPFNHLHEVSKENLARHVSKCPDKDKNVSKLTCPFNPAHILKKNTVVQHITSCPDKNKEITTPKVATVTPTTTTEVDPPKQAVEGGPVRVLIRKEDVKFEAQAKRKKASDYFNL